MEFRLAKRTNAKPLVGLYAESGAGKTYSALLLARGFVGPSGRIGMIETESGRGEAYSDVTEYPEIGGYEVLSLHGNFSPETYGKAIDAAEAAKFDALIIDSASHEWEGVGGVLDMAASNEAAGKKGQLIWQKPKIDHQRYFMLRFMQTSIPLVILCMRAKYPMVQTVVNGKKEWTRSDRLDPKQSDDILFEMTSHGWIDDQHKFHRTKSASKALEALFMDNEPITVQTGAKLAAWARGEGAEGQLADLIRQSEGAARDGLDALRAFWTHLAKSDREAIKSQANRLKAIAEKSDVEAVDPILGPETAPETPQQPDTAVLGSQGAPIETGLGEAQEGSDGKPESRLDRGLRLLPLCRTAEDVKDLAASVGEELEASDKLTWDLKISLRLGEINGKK